MFLPRLAELFGRGPEDAPVDDGSLMIRPTCYNPLSIGYANMPIGLEAGNPNVKTGALTGTVQPVAPKADVPQKGQGFVGDVINLFNPSSRTTTRVLGLGFGMAGGCNGITNCQCGGAPIKFTDAQKLQAKKAGVKIVGDILKDPTKFKKGLEDFSMKQTGKTVGENVGEALVKGTVGLAKGAYSAYSKSQDEAEAKRLAELKKKAERPLEWYEKLGKKAVGALTGSAVPFGSFVSKEAEKATECAMRGISNADCRKLYPLELPTAGQIAKEVFTGGLVGGGEVDGLYNDEIEKITDKMGIKVPVIAADEMDEIVRMVGPNTKEYGFIINTNPSSSDGSGNDGHRPGHWMAVYIENDEDRPSIEFFDPLADPMDPKMIDGIKKIIDKIDNEKYFLFKENMVKHQSDDSNTCGHHSIRFLENRFGGMSWPEATGFKKCMDQSSQKEKELMNKVKKYENYL